MKIPFALLLTFVVAVQTHSSELTLELVPATDAPSSLRLDVIERYLQIQRHDWRLNVPEGYQATLIFRRKSEQKILLELTNDGQGISNLFLVTVPDRSNSDTVEVTFGDQTTHVTTFMPQREGWQIKYGNPGANTDNNLFEIWNPVSKDGPLFWCEVLFTKE